MTRLDKIAARLEATDNGHGAFSALRPEFDALLAVVREVAGLHRAEPGVSNGVACNICRECLKVWPCPTCRALESLTKTTEETR